MGPSGRWAGGWVGKIGSKTGHRLTLDVFLILTLTSFPPIRNLHLDHLLQMMQTCHWKNLNEKKFNSNILDTGDIEDSECLDTIVSLRIFITRAMCLCLTIPVAALTVHSMIVMGCAKSQCHWKLVMVTMRLVRRQRETEEASQKLLADFVKIERLHPIPSCKGPNFRQRRTCEFGGPCLFLVSPIFLHKKG